VCWPGTISSGFWPAGPDVPATRMRNDGTAGVHVDGEKGAGGSGGFNRLMPCFSARLADLMPHSMCPPSWTRNARARQRFLGPAGEIPLVLIVDRYGAAWSSFPSRGHAFPPPKEVVDTLRHLAFQCPECGAPAW
jgi:hypothetical protein